MCSTHITLSSMLVTLLLLEGVPVRGQEDWWVDDDNCPGPGSGTAGDPFCSIQAGIDAAGGGDTVEVLPGTYNEAIDFLGKAITLRSTDGQDVTTIDATGLATSVVTCRNGEGPASVLEGFTITGGAGTFDAGFGITAGGGMYNWDSSPTLVDCMLTENMAEYGGGMWNDNANPNVIRCTLKANTATLEYAPGGGGMTNFNSDPMVADTTFSMNRAWSAAGMFNALSNPTVTRCTFAGNIAEGSGGSEGMGGGIYNAESSPTITDCAFLGNVATSCGGAMVNDSSEELDPSNPTVTNCTFNGNRAWQGGGMCNVVGSSPEVINSLFGGNVASYGGGIYNVTSHPSVTGCTFYGDSQGMVSFLFSLPTVMNSILWGNETQIYNDNKGGSTPIVRFSNVQGGLPAHTIDGGGNIDNDPMFVSPGYWHDNGTPDDQADDYWVDGDYRLQPGSLCKDVGDAASLPGDPLDLDCDGNTVERLPIDLDGHARVLCTGVDMGPYESGAGDHECDEDVDLDDFAAWEACMSGPDSGPYDLTCEPLDFEYFDNDVDLADFATLQRYFTGRG